MCIQKNYYTKRFLFSFFHNELQYYVTIDDLVQLLKQSRAPKSLIQSRQLFSSNMGENKAKLITRCIIRKIMLLSMNNYNPDIWEYLLMVEFPENRETQYYDVDIFAYKIENEVSKLL